MQRLCMLLNSSGFAGERGLFYFQPADLKQSHISRHNISCFQKDDVPRDDP